MGSASVQEGRSTLHPLLEPRRCNENRCLERNAEKPQNYPRRDELGLGVSETVIRRMLNPKHDTKPGKIQAALAALGKRIVVTFEDAA